MSTQPRPAYRYLEVPAPATSPSFARGLRWGLLFSGLLWALILAAGYLVAQLVGSP